MKNLHVQGKMHPWDPLKVKEVAMCSVFASLSGEKTGFSWLLLLLMVIQSALWSVSSYRFPHHGDPSIF